MKPVLTTPQGISDVCQEANQAAQCLGLMTWMHTFSPAKMWIAGLKSLRKPFAHLHTQFNRDIPWSTIDMDFMNLNQSAHGGPRVRLHLQPPAAEPQGDRGSLAGPGSQAPVGGLDAGGRRLARCAAGSRSPASATTCGRWR